MTTPAGRGVAPRIVSMDALLEETRSARAPGRTQRDLQQLMSTLESLRPYFEDEEVNEIEINAPHDVFINKRGREYKINVPLTAGQIRAAITIIASLVEKEVGSKSGQAILSARLPGFRVEAVLPPVAVYGPSMCIRRHAARVYSMEEYVSQGIISEKYAEMIKSAVDNRETFLVVGGTGSGKTTLLNAIVNMMPKDDRLFVLETVHELQITAPNRFVMECDADQGVTPRMGVRTAMRYAPKRVIVGELRGPEAFDWLDAANTGHPGSAATIHANGARKGLPRLENLLLQAGMGVPLEALRVNIAETVQWMFYIERNGAVRKMSEVCRLHGYDRARGEYELEVF